MKVRIYKPSKSAMQSTHARKPQWRLEYIPTSKRQPDPLMGWASSKDTLNQVRLKFSSREKAISYAKKQGWDYSVTVDRDRKVKPQSYMDNFKYVPPTET